ncbi:hypothetical protein [Streptomyces sp. UNOC14_S4]|uniref:hypothetical protein n=1 Tax=Streptomyces sp. UNOC14_S4 TaxID=2872340 RepID=UPI001E346211|nr:hypothetical protein [Streptomyces sp. UNOC14_S4]
MAFYDPGTRSLKTSQGTFLSDSMPSSLTLPPSGSMRSGALFARPTSAPPTSANASSSSRGLPTPAARDWRGGGQSGQLPTAVTSLLPTPSTSEATGAGHAAQGGMNLRHVVSLLPTPVVGDSEGARQSTAPHPRSTSSTLTDLAFTGALLPTPRASENENRQTKRTPSQEAGTHGKCLAAEVASLLPTPRATVGTKGGPNQRGSKGDLTLPSAAHRIGATTLALSPAGNAPSGDVPPGQLMLWDD